MAGPEVASKLLVDECKRLAPDLRIENATLRSANMEKGRLDMRGLAAFARAYVRFVRAARDVDIVYLVAAANTVGCTRDAVLVATARMMRRQVVIHFRGGRYGEYYDQSKALFRTLLRLSWGGATRAIVQAPRLRAQVARVAPKTEITVLPNGLPAASFAAKSHYASPRPRLLFVGHHTVAKGFYDLMHAFRSLRAKWPELVLASAGELPRPNRAASQVLPPTRRAEYLRRYGEFCDEIRAFVAKGQESGVEYAGVVSGDAKVSLFGSADIFVLPSYTEGFSVAVLEAMFQGLPIITSTCGGLPDVVKHGENGLLVEPGDVDGLIRAIDHLLSNPGLREEMGNRNAREARERYDISVVARRLVDIVTLSPVADAHVG
jgi:glycosyltransferase involved in cell wall biosynthesis